jgi:hypothetical protein
MKPRLSKAATQLREQLDDFYPSRLRDSDGWIGDLRHAARKSDHNPDAQGWVRAIDIDADLSGKPKPELMPDLVDQVRLLCKSGVEKRVSYIIFNGRICSPILRWKWRTYKGINKHTKHAHFSFKKEADNDGAFFKIPMLGGTHDSGKQ